MPFADRMNNLSIRNKLRLFTLGTCMILTAFFLVSVWMTTNRAVHQDVRGELNEAVMQFNHAEQDRLKENLQAGKDVADIAESPRPAQILASRDKVALCEWGTGMLHRAGLSPKHRTAGDKPATLELVSLVDPDDRMIGLVDQGKNHCESVRDESPFPPPQDQMTPEITDWESAAEQMYELVQAPVTDSTGRYLGRLVVGFQVDDALAERIVNHAEHQQRSAAKGTSATPPDPQAVEVALWHMDGSSLHILGLSGQGKMVSRDFVQSALTKKAHVGQESSEFDAGGYSFINEPFGQNSGFFNNPEGLQLTVIQDTRPKLAAFHKLEGLMLLLAALAMLLGVFAGSFFSRPIAVPLIGLAEAAESIAEGNLDTAHAMITESQRKDARDEIGMLQRSFLRMVRGLKERLAMSTFLSQATYDHICSVAMDEGGSADSAVRASLAVLFSDIRGFTHFSETQDPEAVITLLNEVLSLQAGIVERHGGDINKFIGDAVFAWFAGDDRCQRAAAAAKDIITALDAQFAGRPGTQVGIGIHVGDLVVGSVGSHDRRDYTAIGSVVNKAARLCSSAQEGQILVSAEAAAELNGAVPLTPLAPISLKGIAEPVPIFAITRPTA